jgi:hypothetical protein
VQRLGELQRGDFGLSSAACETKVTEVLRAPPKAPNIGR